MSDFKHKAKERVSRQQAAERLTDIAYALTAGPPLELSVDHQRISVPVPDDLLLEYEMTSKGDDVELEVDLSWSSAAAPAPASAQAMHER
jgi:amphi-Trp domain-containing protein